MPENKRLCDVCEGTGRLHHDPSGQTFICWNGCDNGHFEMTAADIEGFRVRYRFVLGRAVILHGSLCIEDDEGVIVCGLTPDQLEIIDEEPR